ncbi:hypothetical protein BJY00DRAFT_319474 [Aspergillus carlsbadensis]|nr:hypothetical protein BJY00DRAFT_319474 [Aspergillus carlsbadensis]
MRFHLPAALLAAALGATPALAGQKVVAVWSSATFSTVGGQGNTHSFASGFNLITENGEGIYGETYPDGYKPCINVGTEFKLDGGCFGGAVYSFRCNANPIGIPETCKVIGPEGNDLGRGDGSDNTDFFGLGISQEGSCRVEFELVDGIDCGEDGKLSPHHQDWDGDV